MKNHNKHIHIKGAREHNLKNLDVKIPRDKLVVITGVSGSGKSSLAFDTLYAEGYRKYMDSLSARAKQFLDQIKQPDIDFIHGLSPVISVEQHASSTANPRSTVATSTEIADYARLLWSVCGQQACPKDGGKIISQTLDDCIDRIFKEIPKSKIIILAPYLTAKKSIIREEIPRLTQRGYTRLCLNGQIMQTDDYDFQLPSTKEIQLDLVIDRTLIQKNHRSRIADSLEIAFREGQNQAFIDIHTIDSKKPKRLHLTQDLACQKCNTPYDPITPRHFSYNHPEGACEECHGLGEITQFQEKLVIPDPTKSVKHGALKAYRIGGRAMIIRRNSMLKKLAEQLPFDPLTPWEDLSEDIKKTLLYGAGEQTFNFGRAKTGKYANMKFEGIMNTLNRVFRESKSDNHKSRLLAFQLASSCQKCNGTRLSSRTRAITIDKISITDFFHSSIRENLKFIQSLQKKKALFEKVSDATNGLEKRLHFLNQVGLDYLTLDRKFRTLSGGEAQRTRLATQLGMGLMGVVYILDEPSIGLHAYDQHKLIDALIDLRDRGNSVIVVEHDEETMQHADHIIELGPSAGIAGGEIQFSGTLKECKKSKKSRTGAYLSGKAKIKKDYPTLPTGKNWITVKGAYENNLKNVDVSFPVGLVTAVCGVSGSGKSTLVNDILGNAAAFKLNREKVIPGKHKKVDGINNFTKLVRVTQSPIGRSPRSNPATYVKLFDELRNLFSQCALSKIRGYKPGRFSFNVAGGRCEKCRGDGMIELDMQFLGQVYVDCPSCHGKRYNRETLEVRFKGLNVSEVLKLSVSEALEFFRSHPKALPKLQTLEEVGLGYLKLGQPANTLSGGEAQRIKLSLELSKRQQGSNLYILDEPTTGLHWDDIQKLMDLIFRLRDTGNTIIIIEHHLDVIKLADWIIELGPEGGEKGGNLIHNGTVKDLLKNKKSLTRKCIH